MLSETGQSDDGILRVCSLRMKIILHFFCENVNTRLAIRYSNIVSIFEYSFISGLNGEIYFGRTQKSDRRKKATVTINHTTNFLLTREDSAKGLRSFLQNKQTSWNKVSV